MSSSLSKKDKSQPLCGVRVLVTRARGQAEEMSSLLRTQGADVVEIPVLQIVAPRSWIGLDSALRQISKYDWLILTSANGVEALEKRMRRLRIPLRSLRHLRVAAIGPATRAALESRGVRVHVTPKEYVAESVAGVLKSRVNGQRVLLVRAAVAREVLPEELRRAGAQVTVATAYETRAPREAAPQLKRLFIEPAKRPAVVTCTSSSAANNYLELTRGIPEGRRVAFASIGPITSSTLRQKGIEPAVEARSYTAKGLAQAIVRWAKAQGRADL